MSEILLPLGTQSETGLYAKAVSVLTNVLSAAIALSEVPNSGGLYTNSEAISGLTVGQEYLLLAYRSDDSLIAKGGPYLWTGSDFESVDYATFSSTLKAAEAFTDGRYRVDYTTSEATQYNKDGTVRTRFKLYRADGSLATSEDEVTERRPI